MQILPLSSLQERLNFILGRFLESITLFAMDLTAALIKDVEAEEDDFGHEMRVRHVLAPISKAKLEHGGTYTDEVTGKPRQFDFRVEVETGHVAFRLAIECKRLAQVAPLVVCGTTRSKHEAYHNVIISRSACSGIGDTFSESAFSFVSSVEESAYLEGGFVGKSMLRLIMKREGSSRESRLTSAPDADVYERWSQALSSAHELCERAAWRNDSIAHQSHPAVFTVVMPFVVVPDNTLWQVSYDSAGGIQGEPTTTNECEYFVGRAFVTNRSPRHRHKIQISHLHFVTLTGLRNWVEKLLQYSEPQAEGLAFRERWVPAAVRRGIP